jgi:hypothetical protein
LRVEGCSFSLDVLYGGLGMSKFLIKKRKGNFVSVFFSSIFGHQNPGSELDQDPEPLEMLDPDLDSMNPDPQL